MINRLLINALQRFSVDFTFFPTSPSFCSNFGEIIHKKKFKKHMIPLDPISNYFCTRKKTVSFINLSKILTRFMENLLLVHD